MQKEVGIKIESSHYFFTPAHFEVESIKFRCIKFDGGEEIVDVNSGSDTAVKEVLC